jgi:hypothetical protein
LTCSSFSDFVSKSKIPPKFGFADRQIGEQGGQSIDAFGFHDACLSRLNEPIIIPEWGRLHAKIAASGQD